MVTQSDGFYFISKVGSDQTSTSASNLASGIKYYAAVCATPTGAFRAARYIDHKLANKEFDEEDFYVGP